MRPEQARAVRMTKAYFESQKEKIQIIRQNFFGMLRCDLVKPLLLMNWLR